MKCLRCGKEILEGNKICEHCGFDISTHEKLEKVYVEVDPEVDETRKITLIDMPILTFVFGILSIMVSLLIALSGKPIPFFYLILFGVIFGATFFFSTRPCRVKLKPVREFGMILAFIALIITTYNVVIWLLEIANLI